LIFLFLHHKVLTDGVKDQDEGQAVEDTGTKFGIMVLWWERVADRWLLASVTKYTKLGCGCPDSDVQE
jgi:hypothetical protein